MEVISIRAVMHSALLPEEYVVHHPNPEGVAAPRRQPAGGMPSRSVGMLGWLLAATRARMLTLARKHATLGVNLLVG